MSAASSADPVYAKTESGRAELLGRTGTLRGRLRAALIVVNGQAPVSALQQVIGGDAATLLAELCALGHIEIVDVATRERADAQASAPDSVAEAGGASAGPLLDVRRADAIRRLVPHFGPDVGVVARPLLQAADATAFDRALEGIEQKLALYLGRREAARTLAGLRIGKA